MDSGSFNAARRLLLWSDMTRWVFVAALLCYALPARAEDLRAEMARALEAAADVEPVTPVLPTVSPVAERPAVPGQKVKAAVQASATEHGRSLAAAFARAVREASATATDNAIKVRAHGRERPGRGVER